MSCSIDQMKSARSPGPMRRADSKLNASQAIIVPNSMVAETKVPESSTGVVGMYALNDAQVLLAKLRYNRLVDIFTGVISYSLQTHLRTTVPNFGEVETDEIYVGVDKRGAHHVFPVQARGRNDVISVLQIERDMALCKAKFPALVCRPIAAQLMADDLIALFELEESEQGIVISSERHYRLVPGEDVTEDDLKLYRRRQE